MPGSSSQKRLIINADDLGFSAGVTEGIIQAHVRGVVTSATIAANMPWAQDAARRLKNVETLGVGVHLNASQGPALSRRGAVLAGADGVMRKTGPALIRACIGRPALLDVVEAEFDAQIRWAFDHGISPTHLDSHRHVHAYGPIFARVAALARRYHIPFVRRLGERLPGRRWASAPLRQRVVSRLLTGLTAGAGKRAEDLLPTNGTWGVAHTGLIDKAFLMRAARCVGPGTTEIMTHPGAGDGVEGVRTRLVESRRAELEALCDPAVAEAFADNGVQLVHYGQLRLN